MFVSKKIYPVISFVILASLSFNAYATTITAEDISSLPKEQQISVKRNLITKTNKQESDFKHLELTYNLLSQTNKETGLAPDYWGLDQFSDFALLSNKMLEAMVLNATGYNSEAEKSLDYFANKLAINKEEIYEKKDTNNIYGILKLVDDLESGEKFIAIVDGISTSDKSKAGRARSLFYVSPRSLALMISAMLKVNASKYNDAVIKLGEALLSFYDSNTGAILDSDRMLNYTHSSEQLSVYSAFVMLAEIDDDPRWSQAAENAYFWFTSHSLNVSKNLISQGYDKDVANETYTTSAYTHYFLSPAADKASISVIKQLTDRAIQNSLCNISLDLPNGNWVQVTMADDYNPLDPKVIEARGGIHPRGSLEQSIYFILMLQKNASRLRNHDSKTAKLYLSIANILINELKKIYYPVDGLRGLTSLSNTQQNQSYLSLGAKPTAMRQPIYSPYFYVNNKNNPKESIKAAISISSIFNLVFEGINPFVLNDSFSKINSTLSPNAEDHQKAMNLIKYSIRDKIYSENNPQASSDTVSIKEPEKYNQKMWQNFNLAEKYKAEGDTYKSRRSYEQALFWAFKTVNNSSWYTIAVRDNEKKSREINGIIDYPQGLTFPNNESSLHTSIMRYPILNEMGTAMWAIATINYELTNRNESKRWIRKIIENIPLHQIASTDGSLINGYWNALEAWEDNPNRKVRDQKMNSLYMEVLSEMGLESAKPNKVKI